MSLLMGISDDQQDPFEFHQLFLEGGTDQYRFFCFMEDFIGWMDANRENEQFCFNEDG